jgi:aspartate racemase
MKRIGILGGTSAESTVDYYRYLTREYTKRFGDHGYPEIVIYSVTFQRFIEWMNAGDWPALAGAVIEGLRALGAAGAEIGLIASNTFHRVFDQVNASAPMPMISILDVVADRLLEVECRRPALLGTRLTMAGSFYPERLSKDGIEPVVPSVDGQTAIDRIIFEELSRGLVTAESRTVLLDIARALIGEGADAVILGCTELPLLTVEDDLPVPVLDTTRLHARAVLKASIG